MVKYLDTIRAVVTVVLVVLGSGGAIGLWRLFTGDFLKPYRVEVAEVRARSDANDDRRDKEVAELRARTDAAEQRATLALSSTRDCEAREAALRLALIRHGIPLDPPEPSP